MCDEVKIRSQQKHALRGVQTPTYICLLKSPTMDGRFTWSRRTSPAATRCRLGYKFALRARLNLLLTKSAAKRVGRPIADDTCSRCRSAPETLCHILSACPINAGLMRKRHNNILRLVRAVPRRYISGAKIQGPSDDLCPDLVVLNNELNTAILVDVTVPIETSLLSFTTARNKKTNIICTTCLQVVIKSLFSPLLWKYWGLGIRRMFMPSGLSLWGVATRDYSTSYV